MMRHISLAIALLFAVLSLAPVCRLTAQPLQEHPSPALQPDGGAPASDNRYTTHATLFGIGRVQQLDTYLSPLNYKGPQVNFLRETLRPTHWKHVSVQSLWQADLSMAKNNSGKMNLMGGNMSFDIGWHRNWLPAAIPHLRLMAGGMAGGNIGFLYHTRNSNNPAQALASLRLSASVAAIYGFHIKRQHFHARYQLDMPLAGIMFSPNYNQSYYEIFTLGNSEHNVRFTYPGNAPSFRQQLTLDFPLAGHTFRMGYLCDIRQSHVNGLKHHAYTHAFMLGWVKHFTFHKRDEAINLGFIL